MMQHTSYNMILTSLIRKWKVLFSKWKCYVDIVSGPYFPRCGENTIENLVPQHPKGLCHPLSNSSLIGGPWDRGILSLNP